MVTVHEVEQGSEAWHKLRDGLYTGSNAWKLLKYGAIDYSLTEQGNFSGNFWTKRGHILEDEAIELYETINHVHVNRVGFVTNDRFPSCGYSPDGVMDARLIEVKCFDEKNHRAIYNGEVPLKILAQIHFGLLITELPEASLIIYNPNLEAREAYKVINIKANPRIKANFERILTKDKVVV